MENCKVIQDLILTDYIDGEVDQVTKQKVETHLLTCAQCRELVGEVKENLVVPFKRAARETVPDHVWTSIKNQIEEQQHSSAGVGNFLERFIESLSFTKLVPVLASFMILILIGSTAIHHQRIQQAKEKEQGEYLVSLFGSMENFSEAENNNGETLIEKYFL